MDLQKIVDPGSDLAAMVGRRGVFISYSHHDSHFVPLLKKLLDLHHHGAWSAESDLRGGARFDSEIEDRLRSADAMIVILSRKSLASKWMTKEIATFQAVKPSAPVIPVMLERIDADRVVPGLDPYQAVDFSKCLLTGFESLFRSLGQEFLSKEAIGERRTRADRRAREDRRKTSATDRMRLGLVLAYAREAGRVPPDVMRLEREEMCRLRSVLTLELKRYELFDRADVHRVEADTAVDLGLRVAEEIGRRGGEVGGIEVLTAIADRLSETYEIRMVERRTQTRRADNRRG